MSLASAIRSNDVAELPGKRDEAWRWTDLRGLLRSLPAASSELDPAEAGEGPFAAIAQTSLEVLNGRASNQAKNTVR